MHINSLKTAGIVTLSYLIGTSCNIHDNTINIPDAKVNVTTDIDATNVAPGQQIPVMMTVDKIFLIDPAETPPAEHVADAGHVQVYMDTTATEPLLITAQATFNVTVPAQTKAGGHKLICRVHHHDGTPTTTQMEISITVKVTGTVGDASVTVEIDSGAVGSGGSGTVGSGGATGTGGSAGAGGGLGAAGGGVGGGGGS